MSDLDEIVGALERGEAVVLPTDTVYGLCALPAIDGAVDNLFELKGRSRGAPVAVLCASPEQALGLADEVSPDHRNVARLMWPGPLTMVLRRRGSLSWDLGQPPETIGVRVPDHDVLRVLTRRLGPIAATSANRHGMSPARTPAEAATQLGDDVPVLDGGRLSVVASTVVDATSRPWRLLREGEVSIAELEAAGAPL